MPVFNCTRSSIVAKSRMFLKFAKFQKVRTERNKRLLLCLLPSADDVQTSPGAGSRCKGTIKFADVQENTDFFFAIFNLEDARGASYSLRAPHNATSVIGDPAEFRGGGRPTPNPSLKGREGICNDHPTPNGIRDNKQTRSRENLADGTAKCTPKHHERFWGSRRTLDWWRRVVALAILAALGIPE